MHATKVSVCVLPTALRTIEQAIKYAVYSVPGVGTYYPQTHCKMLPTIERVHRHDCGQHSRRHRRRHRQLRRSRREQRMLILITFVPS